MRASGCSRCLHPPDIGYPRPCTTERLAAGTTEPLPAGAIAGIVVGAVTTLVIVLAVLFFRRRKSNLRRRQRDRLRIADIDMPHSMATVYELQPIPSPAELPGNHEDDRLYNPTSEPMEIPALYKDKDITYGLPIYVKIGLSTMQRTTGGGLLCDDTRVFYLTAQHSFSKKQDVGSTDALDRKDWEIQGWDDFDDKDDIAYGVAGIDAGIAGRGEATFTDGASGTNRVSTVSHKNNNDQSEPQHNQGRANGLNPTESADQTASFIRPNSNLARATSTPVEPVLPSGDQLNELGTTRLRSPSIDSPGLDYNLIQLSDHERIRVGSMLASLKQPVIRKVAEGGPKELKIVALTACGGWIEGKLLGTSTTRIIDEQNHMQDLWTVHFDGKILPGDSGSWVFDPRTHEWYGHIIEASSDGNLAYIVPARDIIHDIRRWLVPSIRVASPGDSVWSLPPLPDYQVELPQPARTHPGRSGYVPDTQPTPYRPEPAPVASSQKAKAKVTRKQMREWSSSKEPRSLLKGAGFWSDRTASAASGKASKLPPEGTAQLPLASDDISRTSQV